MKGSRNALKFNNAIIIIPLKCSIIIIDVANITWLSIDAMR